MPLCGVQICEVGEMYDPAKAVSLSAQKNML